MHILRANYYCLYCLEFSIIKTDILVGGDSRSTIWSSVDEPFAPNEWNNGQVTFAAKQNKPTIELIFQGDCAPGDSVSLRNLVWTNVQNDEASETIEVIDATGGMITVKVSPPDQSIDTVFYRAYVKEVNSSDASALAYAGILYILVLIQT